jgi:hypothetical protein
VTFIYGRAVRTNRRSLGRARRYGWLARANVGLL